ncbi:MAG: hypothetical protein UV82_C0009G0062 [Candidatus Magasanikbacteria bacterium GW2011_GWD2_43_18]|uniref:Uncharacterized protein n=1 Tax=Candidatus Magasanikbacteria bacterium GW2011_GWE2_42_7 TaxID=1619052 RepID=A0A0G1BE47_9BACT|nr:MAG: hypothetical protein UV18_C0004G0146 [Candidatus Magasanikbacteria bacterium GW2011_GWC2_42_27]KKS71582.1 MAG: hypothetical protein UV42_C0024G0004 [Candidatus Magasanikbacteria bacterium GW2011_GWE2_42_7]KKT04323.1 MAG: hypothetical protein UV82_C0009G0062 [Candidatus Magasanikbacteria bacterium GW2011_GWD2_43_18]KKT25320.1 MAG: hypothetical protein UW10_C0009G0002 [Candidatus Magasanikbacteria bacterium GW2011_GWA2_43_9]HBB38334.1 hypothetical protein [Candidatus Magasanikbacteria bac
MKKPFFLFIVGLLLIGAGCAVHSDRTPRNTSATDTSAPNETMLIEKLYADVPEISEKSQEIRDVSNGDVTVSVRIDKEHREGDMYPVQVFEDHDTHTVTLWIFYISTTGDTVTHLNELTGEIESLETWRATRDELPE